MLHAAEVNLPLADGGRGEDLFAEFVLGYEIVFLTGANDLRFAIVGSEVDQPCAGNQRSTVAPANTLTPGALAGGGFKLAGNAGVGNDQKVLADSNRRRNVRSFLCFGEIIDLLVLIGR